MIIRGWRQRHRFYQSKKLDYITRFSMPDVLGQNLTVFLCSPHSGRVWFKLDIDCNDFLREHDKFCPRHNSSASMGPWQAPNNPFFEQILKTKCTPPAGVLTLWLGLVGDPSEILGSRWIKHWHILLIGKRYRLLRIPFASLVHIFWGLLSEYIDRAWEI